jgi:hypothetical protein
MRFISKDDHQTVGKTYVLFRFIWRFLKNTMSLIMHKYININVLKKH